MNTRINCLYRDRDNYKVHGMETIRGEITEKQVERICESLYEGEYFLPAMVSQPFEVVTSYSFDETIERKRFPTYAAAKQWAISDILRELSIDLLESGHAVDFHFNGDEGQIIVTGKVNNEGEITLFEEPSITTWEIVAERNS